MWPWPRFTLRSLVAVVAILGLDLATFFVAWNGRPRPVAATGGRVYLSDGSVLRPAKLPGFPPFVERPPDLLFHFRRWAPLMLSGQFTAVVALAAFIRAFRIRREREVAANPEDPS